jgi:hypothetical protein
MSLSNMSAIAGAKKEVLCYNEKALDRNNNYTTKYADYVKAFISVDAENSRCKINVEMFGRDIPVDLEFNQIRKL